MKTQRKNEVKEAGVECLQRLSADLSGRSRPLFKSRNADAKFVVVQFRTTWGMDQKITAKAQSLKMTVAEYLRSLVEKDL